MSPRHCIVTPQFPGLSRNGGIGTHCYYLAQLLEKEGAGTTLLYTHEELDTGSSSATRLPFALKFVWECELPAISCLLTTSFLHTSARCYEWLKQQQFDFIHFQDWRADGFRSVQAKRTGQAFSGTVLTCMLNGPNLWARQGMKLDPFATRDDILLDYCESYAARHCDELLSPSAYALSWVEENWRWRHPRTTILPYMFTSPFREEEGQGAIETLIFFGRLETRKGLELFLASLRALEAKGIPPRRILFVGRSSPNPAGDSVAYIRDFFKAHLPSWPFAIEDFLDHPEALALLHRTAHKLVVIPSWSETLCFTVIECISCNFNFIASRVGGIPELFAESDRLFETTVPSFVAKMEEAFSGRLGPIRASWSMKAAEAGWSDFLRARSIEKFSEARATDPETTPLVSICVPHYNGGTLLGETLAALRAQSYERMEVFVGDDASTDPKSIAEFDRCAAAFTGPGWTFTRADQNRGPGAMRNRLVRLAGGDYVLFVDADNVPEPHMVRKLLEAALKVGLDATGCFMRTRVEDEPAKRNQETHSAWMPVGPALPAVFFGNLVGETNTLFRKSVFQKLGGFSEDANFGNEDWELLILLILQGYQYDVVPEFLLLYRIRQGSHVRTTPSIQNRIRAWRPLFDHLPPEKRFLASSLFIWEWRIEEYNHPQNIPLARRNVSPFERSWLFQLHQLLRHPRKTIRSWFRRNGVRGY